MIYGKPSLSTERCGTLAVQLRNLEPIVLSFENSSCLIR